MCYCENAQSMNYQSNEFSCNSKSKKIRKNDSIVSSSPSATFLSSPVVIILFVLILLPNTAHSLTTTLPLTTSWGNRRVGTRIHHHHHHHDSCGCGKLLFSSHQHYNYNRGGETGVASPSSLSAVTSRSRLCKWANHDRRRLTTTTTTTTTSLCASNDDNNDDPDQMNNKAKPKDNNNNESSNNAKKVGTNKTTNRKNTNKNKNNNQKSKPNILSMINPFNAGKSLRSTVESAIDLTKVITNVDSSVASRLPPDRRSIYYNYYVHDSLGLGGGGGSLELKDESTTSSVNPTASSSLAWTTASSSSSSQGEVDEYGDYRPEVLVVGASGALGRILVKRLLLEGKVRVRVLVRDLYSSTLNKLGTGVTYCQGTLGDMESLEYAVTDVDKIVFCAGCNSSRRLREEEEEVKVKGQGGSGINNNSNGEEWDALESALDRRAKEASGVDGEGLRNLLHAYLNVRHADYGTSQAAKRVLFKFRKRPADIGLFGIDDGSVDGKANDFDSNYKADDDYYDEYDDNYGTYDDDDYGPDNPPSSSYSAAAVVPTLSQCEWKTNKFGHGLFVGKVDRYGEAAIASARLRKRNDPEQGIDLRSGGFAGLVCRVCSDGATYEAFVRTESYERLGVEYVCEFKTSSKIPVEGGENTSRTKWSTVRLEFSDFRPRMRPLAREEDEDAQREMRRALGRSDIPAFAGRDIRQLGFRYRGKNNPFSWSGASNSGWSNFYLALDYIKVYRSQPEPEFVYLSDARIPPVVNDVMVKHDLHRLVTTSSSDSGTSYSIIDEERAKKAIEEMERSEEETYFKYMGEEMIKKSGLSYTIIRVAGYNADLGTDSSAVRLQKMNKDITAISRIDLAQVISSALLTPNACNLVLYMTKAKQRGVLDGDIWQKFARLRSENENEPAPFQ